MERGFDAALISATTRQLKLYRHVGFVGFGPLVGTSEAPFQPMYLTYEAFRERARQLSSLFPAARGEMANLLSGPVSIHPDVVAAFGDGPRSHRSPAFDDDLSGLKASLRALVNAEEVEVLVGSGTLGNDAVAGQLSVLESPGLVVSNGEFGERLVDHASRSLLCFEHLELAWGEPFDIDAIDRRDFDWIWIVACETSTGVLNDVAAVDEICRSRDAKLCIDAVSAIGAVPLDLSRAWLATGASGKALASYPGLALVFHEQPIGVSDTLPRYLDLGLYANDRVPFTHSSNLVRALRVAVERVDWPARFEQTAAAGAWLRRRLRREAFTLIGDRATPAPHIVTIALPPNVQSAEAARTIERAGFLVGHASSYLQARNWIQVCLMGEWQREVLPELLRTLKTLV